MRCKSFHITNEFDVFAVAACADSFAVPFFVLFSLAGYVAPPRSVPVAFHVEFLYDDGAFLPASNVGHPLYVLRQLNASNPPLLPPKSFSENPLSELLSYSGSHDQQKREYLCNDNES